MAKNCVLSIFLTLMFTSLFGQTSQDEKNGFWEQGVSWVGGTMPGSVSGGTISASLKTVVIDGTTKTHNNLTLTTTSLTINAGDTLVVFGNLTLSTTASLVNNGVLMVTGNVTNAASTVNNSATGKMVVMGNYNNSLGLANTITGPTYLYGSETGFLLGAPAMSTQARAIGNE